MGPARGWSARVVAHVCAAASALAGLLTTFAAQGGTFRPSALIKMSADEPLAALARAADSTFSFVTDAEHYDGVYYYAIARDPFARGQAHTLIDQAPYRYGHPLQGWLAGLLSLGKASAVPGALFFLSIAGLAVAGWTGSRLVASFGAPAWWGLLVTVSPGLLLSAAVSTTEAVGAALVLGCLYAARTQRWPLAYLLSFACCFEKEFYVVVPFGLAVFQVLEWRRGNSLLALSRIAWLLAGPVLLGGWFAYVRATLHHWPFEGQEGNIGKPVAGWLRTLRYAHDMSHASFDESEIAAFAAPVLVALAVVLLAACVSAGRVRTELDAPVLALAVLTACQDWRTLLYPHDMFRTTAVAALLAALVLVSRDRQRSAGPVAGAREAATIHVPLPSATT